MVLSSSIQPKHSPILTSFSTSELCGTDEGNKSTSFHSKGRSREFLGTFFGKKVPAIARHEGRKDCAEKAEITFNNLKFTLNMKTNYLKIGLLIVFTSITTLLQAQEVTQKADAENQAKAKEWVASLALNNPEKEARVTDVVALHLTQIRDWHNSHPYTLVPAGVNPLDGKPLSELFRQMIVDSSIPASVHKNLMEGLIKDLTEEQVALVLDKYTISKVAFTMKGYEAIVPNFTETESKKIRSLLEQAREMAVDYKSMKEISAIFEIYKTEAEKYLNNNGRNWHQMYGDYVRKVKAEKAKQKNN